MTCFVPVQCVRISLGHDNIVNSSVSRTHTNKSTMYFAKTVVLWSSEGGPGVHGSEVLIAAVRGTLIICW